MSDLSCPNVHCGRMAPDSPCQACPVGMFSDGTYCLPCDSSFSGYDLCFFTFWVGVTCCVSYFPLFSIGKTLRRRTVVTLFLSSLLEVVLAALFSVLSVIPAGTLNPAVCPTTGISDWYTLFDSYSTYTEMVHCNSSSVYPRSTLVNLFLFYSIVLLVLVRAPTFLALRDYKAATLIYGPCYFLPGLVLLHFVFGGVIYYSFPYILMISCLLFNLPPLISLGIQILKSPQDIFFLVVRYFLLSFAIVAIWYSATGTPNPIALGMVTVFAPALPLLLYILGEKHTHPDYFERW